jgi:hypothetical protein
VSSLSEVLEDSAAFSELEVPFDDEWDLSLCVDLQELLSSGLSLHEVDGVFSVGDASDL